MKKIPDTLPDDVALLKKMLLEQTQKLERKLAQKDKRIAKLERVNQQLSDKLQQLLERYNLKKYQKFSPSSETYEGEGEVLNEAEQLIEDESVATEPDTQTTESAKKAAKPRRPRIAPELPRVDVIHDIDDKTCACCGHALHQMGEEVSEQIEFVPAQIRVLRNVRLKYSCRQCETTDTKVDIKIADVPPAVIPKSMTTPSLLAQIISSKMHYGLPLYRQEQLFNQAGIELSRQTMSRWLISCAEKLKPLLALMKAELLKQPVLWADETTVNVLDVEKSTCYMWVYGCGLEKSTGPKLVLFDYQDSRSSKHPTDFLAGFNGYLQVDGYAGYEKTHATLVGCWAHARRKFVEAQKAQGKGKTGKADVALNHIQKLYALESKLKTAPPDKKYEARQTLAKPLLAQFKSWLDKSSESVTKESLLGAAITYSLNQWPKLVRYLDDGCLNIDNNRAERAIKPFVIGRKAWLFANTKTGAQASAALYSLVETSKINGLEPYDYLCRLLTELPKANTQEKLQQLLPY
ncbi:IS66 family transposase [Shewanella oncorhynchi]|uniref:IS66 family transposase n=1 Tax=Shewanella TaxID=22 RepID=UPI000C12B6F8|nr:MULTISPECIES: IS66 family transposase [Shewanella]MCS6211089.1 IS66 family transposase [Shewanella baltica]MCU7962043.1 IS66 family transposase [Shewanella sp. SW32]MCU7969975.1 IS66 family transposase [Shewanella sp. SW29]MCU7988242.1 IS66 family transposase [Shewanella sp. SW24]MCU8001067.1 IS66 family transposase [Shewanella sp. SM95]